MNTNQAKRSRNLPNGLPYVYASYVNNLSRDFAYVAVIDPNYNQIIQRISGLFKPTAMCTDPSEQHLFVVDDYFKTVILYRTNDFKPAISYKVGTTVNPKPVAVFVEPNGKKAYVANYGDRNVTIINLLVYNVKNVDMVTSQPGVLGMPFAFTSNENSSYVYVACKRENGDDYLVAIGLEDDKAYPIDTEGRIAYNDTRNPLAIHPDGHTLVSLGDVGMLNYVGGSPLGQVYGSTSLLDNTVSGVYLDNKMLFCTGLAKRNYLLKVFQNLEIDSNRNITYEKFNEIPSRLGQDIIRTSRNQTYVGVTFQPTYFTTTSALQIIDVKTLQNRIIELDVVGDMTFFADEKAFVAEINSVLPIDLATMLPQNPIPIGGNDITVRNVISGYSNQSH